MVLFVGTSYLILIMVLNIVMLLIGLGAGAAVAWIFASRFLKKAQQQRRDTFGNLSAEALRNNNESFVQMAKVQLEEKIVEAKGELGKKEQAIETLVKPLRNISANSAPKPTGASLPKRPILSSCIYTPNPPTASHCRPGPG
jgi:hypothetical protein